MPSPSDTHPFDGAGPALALLELDSIALGLVVVDAMVKRASIVVNDARSVSPGRFLIFFSGGVGEVESSFQHGKEQAKLGLLDALILQNPHPGLLSLLAAPTSEDEPQPSPGAELSLGVVECYTSASALAALDASLKTAAVEGCRLAFGNQLGGKGFFVIRGALEDVDAALLSAAEACSPGMLQRIERVARPAAEAEAFFGNHLA